MTTWFTSDLHISHDKFFIWGRRVSRKTRFLRRYKFFKNVDQMNAKIYRTIFDQVQYGDTVYFLGDIAMTKEKYEIVKTLFLCLDNMGVKIVWHLGNHDNKNHPKRILEEFPDMKLEWIPMHEVRTLREDSRFATSHFPLEGTAYADADGDGDEREAHLPYVKPEVLEERVLLHGHTHSTNKGDGLKMIHVGFDARNRLVSLEELIAEHMVARQAARK